MLQQASLDQRSGSDLLSFLEITVNSVVTCENRAFADTFSVYRTK